MTKDGSRQGKWTRRSREEWQALLNRFTCRLHGVDPYDYLVDVLQRVGQHPAADVEQLTPRLWKDRFAANPLRSDVHGVRGEGRTPTG